MYAVIATGGKQYKVAPKEKIRIELIEGEVGGDVSFDQVLLVHDGKQLKVGKPTLQGAKVTGKLVENMKADKVVAFKKRRRKDSKKKQGHRQPMSVVEIVTIQG